MVLEKSQANENEEVEETAKDEAENDEQIEESDEKNSEPTDEQMYSALSFCVMLVLVGIPLWWKTTEVYRVSLPYSEIEQLKPYDIKIHLNIHVATIDEARGTSLIRELNNIFQISKLYNVTLKQHSIKKVVLGSSKHLEEIESKISHPMVEGSIQLLEVPGLSRFTPKNIILGQDRTVYFSTETDAVKLYNFLRSKILNEDALLNAVLHMSLPMKTGLDRNSRRRIPPADEYDILFTVLHPEPESLNISFDIVQAIEDYIAPFLDELSDLNNFHVKSQWLYFVNLQVQPKLVNVSDYGRHYALSQDLLAHIITPLEKKLAAHVSKHPCLNFVLWTPPCSLSPMHIYDSKGHRVKGADAFLSPRWGGIQIFNSDRSECEKGSNMTVRPDAQYVMSIFLQQLRLLLGIPDAEGIEEGEIVKGSTHLRLWEKDALIRIRTIEQLTTAKHTLQSLSKLLGKISNIVINDHVGEAIYSSLNNINEATDALTSGRLMDAYRHSKAAFLSSETAFMDPSLLALLYFPDDQKYAVYIPLFLPIMIPVLISFKSLRDWAMKKLRSTPKEKTE